MMTTISIRDTRRLVGLASLLAVFSALLSSLQRLQAFPPERHIEMLVGALLIWLPWVAAVPLVGRLLKSFPLWGEKSRVRQYALHMVAAVGLGLTHLSYLRLIRPLPEMIFVGGSYNSIYSRFSWGDYLLNLRLFENLLIYAVIALAWQLLVLRRTRAMPPPFSDAPPRPGETAPIQEAHPVLPRGIMLTIRDGRNRVVLPARDISLVEASDYYVTIWSKGRRYLHRQSLAELGRLLGASGFVRSHRSFLVNINEIREVVVGEGGDGILRLHCGREVALSRRRRRAVETAIQIMSSTPKAQNLP